MSVTSYAQTGEDLQIAYFLGHNHDITYIDVGCLWPREHSNSYFFYERGGTGLCIDPNPAVAEPFQKLRPRDTFLNCGIADRPGSFTYHMFGNPVFNTFSEEQVETLARQAESLQGSAREGRTLVDCVKVPTLTLDAAVQTTGFDARHDGSIDFLSIDVEGLELRVLDGFAFDSLRPRLVVAEHIRRSRDRRPPEELPVAQFLAQRGYWVAGFTGHDLYFLDERL